MTAVWPLPTGVRTTPINGYPIAYIERGTGAPVVFVHGSGCDYRFFSTQVATFSKSYRAVSLSLRHYYPEPWRGDGDFSIAQHASDLVAFIRQLGAGPVHLVGHSRGATVSLYAAKAAPDVVRTLSIAEGGGGMTAFAPDEPAQRDARAAIFRAVSEKLAQGDPDAGLKAFVDYLNGSGSWNALPEPARQALRDNAWTFPAAEIDQDRWPPFTCDDARRIDVPVLLLGGALSPPAFGVILDRLQACLPRVERVRIENSAHTMPRMNPAAFDAAVMAFIAAH